MARTTPVRAARWQQSGSPSWPCSVRGFWAVRGLSRGRRGSWTTTVVLLTGWAVFVTGALDVPSMRGFTFLNWGLTLPAIGLLLRRGTREAYRQGAARDMPGF